MIHEMSSGGSRSAPAEGNLLSVKNLVIHYETEESVVEAANNVSFSIRRGETPVSYTHLRAHETLR